MPPLSLFARGAFILTLSLCANVARVFAEAPNDEIILKAPKDEGATALYKPDQKIPVECLNRTIDTGEHITDAKGELQYIPFPTCNETGKPLELLFGSEKDINCTLDALSDPMFHLFEFYIHNDAPLSCRVPSFPPSGAALSTSDYTHLQIALTGTLQLSHLHINPQLNVIMHTATPEGSGRAKSRKNNIDVEGQILAATAYSLPPTESSPKLVIGDNLPFQFSVRWYSARTLPASTSRLASGLGGHVHLSTVMYCILSFGGGIALSLAYWRGIELPRRMKRYGAEKLGISELGRSGYAFPGGNGKRD